MFLFLSFFVSFVLCAPESGYPFMMNVGHRGNPTDAPENTMSAFKSALEVGANGFETDLRFTKDGYIVLSHDPTLDRCTSCMGKIEDKTLEEIRKCDAGSWFSKKFAGEKVPLFSEAVQFAKDNDLFIIMDLKAENLGKAIADIVIPLKMESRVIASCWTDSAVLDIKKYLNVTVKQHLGHVPSVIDEKYFYDQLSKGVHAFSLNTNISAPTPIEFMKLAHKHQMKVFAWTPNDDLEFYMLAKHGLDGIITNVPGKLHSFLGYLQDIMFKNPFDFEKFDSMREAHPTFFEKKFFDEYNKRTSPLIIGHRGDSKHAPENTLAAFRQAKEKGADAFETDLHFTKDGYIVLCHDDTLDRTTNCKGKIAEMNLEDIRKCDAGSWFDPKFSGEKIPLFEEAVKLAKDLGIVIIMDIKLDGLGKEVGRIVKSLDMEIQVVASCRTMEQVEEFKTSLPVTVKQYLHSAPEKFDDSYFIDLMGRDVRSFSFQFNSNLTPEFLLACHKRLIPVVSWVTDDKEHYFNGMKAGHDSIMTDDPGYLKEIIHEIRDRAFPLN